MHYSLFVSVSTVLGRILSLVFSIRQHDKLRTLLKKLTNKNIFIFPHILQLRMAPQLQVRRLL